MFVDKNEKQRLDQNALGSSCMKNVRINCLVVFDLIKDDLDLNFVEMCGEA